MISSSLKLAQPIFSFLCLPVGLFLAANSYAQFHRVTHKKLSLKEHPVKAPGSYAKAGTTYVLTNNITSATSPIFLGNNVTLDLNGYTIKYADGKYEHILNSGFEDGGPRKV